MIIFRCNAGSSVGIGHVVRSRVFAKALSSRGHQSIMVGPSLDYKQPADDDIFADWIPRPQQFSSTDDATLFIETAKAHNAKLAVMDDYRIDDTYQQMLRDAGIRWLQQYDASQPKPFWADLVVNGSPYERASTYKDLIRNPDTKMLLGPAYSILRPEFPPSEFRSPDRPVEQVLVTFGGGDDRGAIILVLSNLIESADPTIQYEVLSGAGNPRNNAIQSWIDKHGDDRVQLHINPKNVASLFASCDLAVIGGGTSTFEAASCGLPMFLLSISDNQDGQCQGWQDQGAAIYIGRMADFSEQELSDQFQELLNNTDRRIKMSAIGRRAVDGKGVDRLISHLLEGQQN